MTNEERSQAEIEAFKAEKPESYFAYQFIMAPEPGTDHVLKPGDKIATWMGDPLATVTVARPAFYSSWSDRRQNFRCKGVNGVEYHGTAYLTAGDYVRMRAIKSR